MRDGLIRPLKIVCLGMGALLVWQLSSMFLGGDPLAHLKIPALPTLPGATNAAAKPKSAPGPSKTGTNAPNGTNVPGAMAASATNSTNLSTRTNSVKPTSTEAKIAVAPAAMPGLPPGMTPEMMASLPPEIMAQMASGGMPGGPRGGAKKVELPPEVKGRVDRIINSEIFGPIIRPTPMALIGIADNEAFIRSTNGQTGPVKVGGELGGIKLLQIGINRVLVEQNGEKKELTLFGGAGGESLLPMPSIPPSANPRVKGGSTNSVAINQPLTNRPLSSEPKETH